MLKLTYTEFGLHLERVSTSLEALVAQHVVLALRLGCTLHVESSRAAFLISAQAPGLVNLERLVRLMQNAPSTDPQSTIALALVDPEFVEISLQGSWIAASADAEEGMFVTALADQVEFFVYKLWQVTQAKTVCNS
ncbi:alr0857 family protein [Myxacorys almedinensis]|uniref:Uncharacterized protein n=1 Tax=Myxacorys almedinensis A TaxID=2690445 RepID=A0A8J8CNG2_9CYAN|nr:alr0857 family protein [Myxacorys almedinensis]NDJ18392.1 hypothetical protein [Myxacorys almedinensis A]